MLVNFKFILGDTGKEVTLPTAKRLIEQEKYYQEDSITIGDISFLHSGETICFYLTKNKPERLEW